MPLADSQLPTFAPAAAPPVVALAGVSRTFRSFLPGRRAVRAVEGLDLEVRPGEVYGLLGPNGSGKTTTLQMILGLLAPTSGRISVFGGPPSRREARRRIGYLPEEFSGQDHLTGEEALRYLGGFYGLGGAEVRRRAEALLRELDLWEDRRRRLREYSKGMRRRIGLAQCLLHDPDLIVLDEPTNGLDPLGTLTVKRILLERRASGRTILVSSHILPEMQDLCDRVAILHRGKILASGPLRELLAVPDRFRIIASGRSLPAEEVARSLRGLGLEVVASGRDERTLEEVFLETLRRSTSGPTLGDNGPGR